MHRKVPATFALLFLLSGLLSLSFRTGQPVVVHAKGQDDPAVQIQTFLYNEARTVYLGNLAREDNGVPPLRWNLQLTYAARWFSWDSVENRPSFYCGHQDTLGRWPSDRTPLFGYLGSAGAENAYCGYDLTPEGAIQAWMNSSGHRANLLDPNSREIGVGFYLRDDGRAYVTQDFGNDRVYAPAIIDDEALSTSSPNVELYIYDRLAGGSFEELGPATQMMVSNDPSFNGALWEPYTPHKSWTLLGGEGWREVYVKTRDQTNRTLTVSDSIYLGASVPQNEIGPAQMATTRSQITIHDLNGSGLPLVQFSPGWLADDTQDSFTKWWGNGGRVNDATAWGGTAYRLYPGDGESFAWVDDWTFSVRNVPLVAYFRLKVSDNTSTNEVARISVQAGSTDYPPLSLKGSDFAAPGQYQEFAFPFTYSPTNNDPFLIFKFWRSGDADLYVDAVSIFSAPQAVSSALVWAVPGGNYRGQGVWVRYTDGTHFSGITEAQTETLQSQTFADVPPSHWAWSFIERLYAAGITGGCGANPFFQYCPESSVNRAQMAVFLLRGIHGSSYSPPALGGDSGFVDVPPDHWAAAWIKQLVMEGITVGCGNGKYCPEYPVTRDQMAVFLLRSKYGAAYSPPEVGSGTGFGDVPSDHWAAAWIKQLVAEGITAGCGGGNYCPGSPVTRAQMAVFLVRTFDLP